jgi:hypothetical protein
MQGINRLETKMLLVLCVVWNVRTSTPTVRLTDIAGNLVTTSKGLLQMNGDEGWKYVCDDVPIRNRMNMVDVACAELGFRNGGGIKRRHNVYQEGTVFYDDVHCGGGETHLYDCPHRTDASYGGDNCENKEGIQLCCKSISETCAGFICAFEEIGADNTYDYYYGGYGDASPKDWVATPCVEPVETSTTVRLTDAHGNELTGGENRGMLQMNGIHGWRYVCDDGFEDNDNGPTVACKELGHTGGVQWDGRETQFDPPFYDEVECTGIEEHLNQCSSKPDDDCSKGEIVSLCCVTAADDCTVLKPTWITLPNSNYEYAVSFDKVGWGDAKSACEADGARLVTVIPPSIKMDIKLWYDENTWIGCNNLETKGFVWADGTSCGPDAISLWADGFPRLIYGKTAEHDRHCVHESSDGFKNTICDILDYRSICERPVTGEFCGSSTFAALSGAVHTCEPCPADTYQDSLSHIQVQCKRQPGCSVGRVYHATTADSKRTCEPCPVGTYLDTPAPQYETECKPNESKVCVATYDVAEVTSATVLCTDGDVAVLKDNTCVCAKETDIVCSALCRDESDFTGDFTEDENRGDYQTCYETCQEESGLDSSGVATIKTSSAAVLLLLLLASTA